MFRIHRVLMLLGVVSVIISPLTTLAQHVPPRTQNAHSIADFADLEPPAIDGFLDLDEAWVVAPQAGTTNNVTDRSFWWVGANPALDPNDLVPSGVVEGEDSPINDDDLSFLVWALYDSQYLYIAVEVRDDFLVSRAAAGSEDTSANGQLQNEDSVEIYIDGDHSLSPANLTRRPEEYATGGQFVFSAGGAHRDVNAGNPTFGEAATADWFAAVSQNADLTRSAYEFRFKLSKIGNPTEGDIIGFNIAVNEADDEAVATRRFQLRWVGQTFDESTYGDLLIGRRKLTAPLVTGAIAIDGQVNEAAWQTAAKDEMNPNLSPFYNISYPKDAADQSATLYVMHDATYLYIACDVRDDVVLTDSTVEDGNDPNAAIWEDDSVEFMIDGDLSRAAANENVAGFSAKFTVAANNAVNFDEAQFPRDNTADADWFHATTSRADGYTIELRAKKTAVLEPDDTAMFGLGIAINEDDGLGNAGFQMDWNGTPNNERSYGIVNLGGAPVRVYRWDLY